MTEENPLTHSYEDKTFIFIAGLHRSGTTVLADCLKEHPCISSFSNTGFPKDEGQFLQRVFPPAREYGGPGKFGFRPEMHLTEHSSLLTPQNRDTIFLDWCRHWDMSKSVLLEKSPPNLLKTRFLQALFPKTYFIVILRHPVAVSYATMKWSKTGIDDLLNHWVTCHTIFDEDKPHLMNLYMLTYEEFVTDPDSKLAEIYRFLGIERHLRTVAVETEINGKYFEKWRKESGRTEYPKIEKEINKYGYSLSAL